ncbi:DUF505 domain-containing protein [Thermotoga sp. SG1]|uniref:DUF505 domain-containing protein n=1 Tax=Thermotoga sp. SG1 TaxID=126739 RepID=UPI000C793673|nr:DUF505 domain-containing protein [Thermotoga sp. SG1]PLV56060.1 hypothetical protein AS006_05710 [Thermotoga sp. SG1]
MVITKRHAVVLKRLYEKGEEFSVSDWEAFDRGTLWHLELAGLVKPVGVKMYDLTFSGNILGELLTNMIKEGVLKDPEEWDDSFRWIGSEVISMIRYSKLAQSRVKGEIAEALEERGFVKEGTLTPHAYTLDEIYNASQPRIVVNSQVAEYLRKMVEGPGESSKLPVGENELFQLESMRMIAFSVPKSDVYALTGLGQQIRAALRKGLVVTDEVILDELVLDTVAKACEGKELSDFEKNVLLERGLIDWTGSLHPMAEHLYLAWKIYRKGPYLMTPAFQISEDEARLLMLIEKLWKRNEQDRDVFPEPKQIEEEVDWEWKRKDLTVKLALYNLEGFGLLRSREYRDGARRTLVYELTSYGEEVLEDQKRKLRSISATGVKSITMTRKEFAAPNVEWYEQAKKEGLVSDAAPTSSGLLYARLSVEVERKPLITNVEMKVLRKVPYKAGIFVEDLDLSEEERIALDSLEAKNLVEILPTGLVTLTDAGQLMKRALSAASDDVEAPVTPLVIRLLQAIRTHGGLQMREKRIRINPESWKAVEEEVGVDPETFDDALNLARISRFISENALTEAGVALLQAVDELAKKEYPWAEF